MQILLGGLTQKISNSFNDKGEHSLSDQVTPLLIYLIVLIPLFKTFQWLFMLFSLPEAPDPGVVCKDYVLPSLSID